MKPVYSFLDAAKAAVKRRVRPVAKALDKISGGKLTANRITIIGLAMHVVIAYLIARGHFTYSALLLVVFGLFDALDGEMARLQGTDGPKGMILDAVSDRMKEVLLYTGVAYVLVSTGQAYFAVWAVAACGGSLLPGYLNAWGEVVLAGRQRDKSEVNQLFRGGLMRFEVRISVLILGLLTNRLTWTVIIIAILAWWTAVERLREIRRQI